MKTAANQAFSFFERQAFPSLLKNALGGAGTPAFRRSAAVESRRESAAYLPQKF